MKTLKIRLGMKVYENGKRRAIRKKQQTNAVKGLLKRLTEMGIKA